MNWNEKCVLELTHHNLFDTTEHRQRFIELLGCYYSASFFTKGLCKCMFLACWDDEHFIEILTMLNDLTINASKNLKAMKDHGDVLIQMSDGVDNEIYRLSASFLSDTYYQLPDFSQMDPDTAHIIRQSLMASRLIDDLPDPHMLV